MKEHALSALVLLMELAAIVLVVTGISLAWSPAGWIVGGVLLFLTATSIENQT